MTTLTTRRSLAMTTVAPLVLAIGAGLATGIATSWLQGVLPGSWNVLADSGALWAVVGFAVAAAAARTSGVSAAAGTLMLLGAVAGYYAIAEPLRHVPTSRSEQLMWTAAALWIGPLAGLAGWAWRRGEARSSACAFLAMCGVVAGEGWYLAHLGTTHAAGLAELGAGAGLAAGAVVWSRPGLRAAVPATVCWIATALLVVVLYRSSSLL